MKSKTVSLIQSRRFTSQKPDQSFAIRKIFGKTLYSTLRSHNWASNQSIQRHKVDASHRSLSSNPPMNLPSLSIGKLTIWPNRVVCSVMKQFSEVLSLMPNILWLFSAFECCHWGTNCPVMGLSVATGVVTHVISFRHTSSPQNQSKQKSFRNVSGSTLQQTCPDCSGLVEVCAALYPLLILSEFRHLYVFIFCFHFEVPHYMASLRLV